MRSACLGPWAMGITPRRTKSCLEVEVALSSMARQARPKFMIRSEHFRPQFRMNFTGWGNSMFSIRASSLFTPLRLHHAKLKLRGFGHPAGVPGRLHYHLDLDVLDARHA